MSKLSELSDPVRPMKYRTVKVPLSKLRFETYDLDGQKIDMGGGVPMHNSRWQAFVEGINTLKIASIEFPKFTYEYNANTESEATLTVMICDDDLDADGNLIELVIP